MEYINRAHQADLEVRGDGRTVVGIAVPFDSPTHIRDASGTYTEIFRRGAFARTISDRGDRVKFLVQHDRRSLPLGRASLLREDATGLYGEFRVSKTQQGDEALELIRDGALDAFSVGFRPIRNNWNGDKTMVERTEARLDEVSAVAFPAYDGALIAGIRDGMFGDTARELLAAIGADPDLADEFRALIDRPAFDAADPGTSDVAPDEPENGPAAQHSGLSPEARDRVLTLLNIGETL